MIINIFDMTPDQPAPKSNCYSCIGCPHLVSASVDSSQGVYIECNLKEEEENNL